MVSKKCPLCGHRVQRDQHGGVCVNHACSFAISGTGYNTLPDMTDDADLYRLPEGRHEAQAAAYSPQAHERRLESHNFEHWRHARPVDITADNKITVHAVRPCKRCRFLTDIDQLSGTGYCPMCVGKVLKESEQAHLEDSRLVVLLLSNLLGTLKERHIDHIAVGDNNYTVHLRKKEG